MSLLRLREHMAAKAASDAVANVSRALTCVNTKIIAKLNNGAMSENRLVRVTQRTYRAPRSSQSHVSRFASATFQTPRNGSRPSRFASGAQRVLFRRQRRSDRQPRTGN